MSNREIVRALFDAYLSQDRAAAERLIASDFAFTSPQDDHIDRVAYFERCFPTAARFSSQDILALADAGPGGVFVLYEYQLRSGGRYRNAEFHTVAGEQVTDVQVFFGGQVTAG